LLVVTHGAYRAAYAALVSERTVTVPTTGLDLCYETFGSPSDPPMLLVMGLGAQMIAWPDELCADLARRGLYVVRFDNRDAGRSTHLHGMGAPDPRRIVLGVERAPYSIADMACDAVGLLDALDFDSAHVVGASMGGFIAQALAISAPERVRSLGLLMTSTGSRRVGLPRPRVIARLGRRRELEATREEAIHNVLGIFAVVGSPAYSSDLGHLAEHLGQAYDRGYDPAGHMRQVAAVLTQGNRTEALASIRVPTVVLHGLSDPLITVGGGRAVARAIPGARFVGFKGMGHSLPRALWPAIADELARCAMRGEVARVGQLA
jgi:pimeloyl-ACP methyl ester carboxylesterase